MRRFNPPPLNPLASVLSLWLCLGALCFLAFSGCGGCAAGKGALTPSTGVYDTNAAASVVVVSAENFRESALNVFDALMTIEKNNDAALRTLNPKIHTFVEKVRRDSKGWLDSLTAAKVAFQNSRTPENASRLKSAVALLDAMLAEATRHLAQAATVKAP